MIGYGSIAKALEKRLLPFGARITGIARSPRPNVSSMSGKRILLSCSAIANGRPCISQPSTELCHKEHCNIGCINDSIAEVIRA